MWRLIFISSILFWVSLQAIEMCNWENKEEIQRLQEYLRIRSVHPEPDYESCVTFLRKQAEDLDLSVRVHEFVPGKPVVVITWQGSQPELPSILLNSHMDVVPVSEEFWTYPPFDAHITEDGVIYARGIQDMKSVGMLHLEAIRVMKQANVKLRRTVHVSFVPDEEIGSQEGMRPFTESEEFKQLNIGFELDESAPNPSPDAFFVFNKERTSRQIKVTCLAKPGHGSYLLDNTAGEKIHYIINKFMELRAQEKKKLDKGSDLGDVTTINLTQLGGGVQINVLPENLTAFFDIRIAPDVDHDAFEEMIETWCKEAGDGVSFEYLVKNPQVASTQIDGNVPFWTALVGAIEKIGKKIQRVTCPGATDARWVRNQGIPAINLTPISNTQLGLHAHNERMHAGEYLKGIGFMKTIVTAVANV